jgi:CheY-like chemotaxis protein
VGPGEETRAGSPDRAWTLLYVEDNTSNIRLVERIVAKRPAVELVVTRQGAPAIDLARLHRPELVLLDVHLPDIEGDEVLRRLKDDPATMDIPVVALSAEATPAKIERFRQAGVRDYLTKPLDVTALLALLDAITAGEDPW